MGRLNVVQVAVDSPDIDLRLALIYQQDTAGLGEHSVMSRFEVQISRSDGGQPLS